jgi:hypothetical protein
MQESVRLNIQDVLQQTITAVELRDTYLIKKLSNYTIHSASIFQDEYSISIAVILYSLSKIMERHRYKEEREWSQIYLFFLGRLKKALLTVQQNKLKSYQNIMQQVFKKISKVDSEIALYVEEVLEKSRVNKGSRIYEHGISLARVAEILGVSEWELMSYVGKTQIIDDEKTITNVRARLKYARGIFNVK